jgi:hypothetical protein
MPLWVGSVALLAIFFYAAIGQIVGILGARRGKSFSLVPLIGGLAGMCGLLIIPYPPARVYWWLPLLLDIGCLPLLAAASVSICISLGQRTRRERGSLARLPATSWQIERISDRAELLNRLVAHAPDGATWSIEGIDDPKVITQLEPFSCSDEIRVPRARVWPRQVMIKLRLNALTKPQLVKLMPTIDLDRNLLHQHIYLGPEYLLAAYDHLDSGCTFISQRFVSPDDMSKWVRDGIITLREQSS